MYIVVVLSIRATESHVGIGDIQKAILISLPVIDTLQVTV
jgi:hypothetical protein